jgi:hypothetical protein
MKKSASRRLGSARLRPRSETAELPDIPTGVLTHFVLKALQEYRASSSALNPAAHPPCPPASNQSPS